MPVRIDDIESDIELEGDHGDVPRPEQAEPPAAPSIEMIEQRNRDAERTRAWDFDD